MSIKILHIIDHLGFGGAQTVVKGIFESQQENRNIFLFVLRKKHNKVFEIQHENVITYNTKAKFSFAPIRKLRKLILKNNINILHCHLFKAQIFGFILKRVFFPGIHLIFHEHGAIVGSDDNNMVENYLYRKFITISARNVNIYIAVSNAIKDKLAEKAAISKDKVVTLYNFIDLNKFNPQKLVGARREQKKLGIRQDDFVVGFAGRVVARKGWKEYVEAAKMLSQNVPNMTFLISGDGTEKDELLALIHAYKLQDKVRFVGYMSDMFQFYSCLDCFVMPSYWEGLSLTQLEVMALGIPLITSDGPGLNEIPRENIDALFVTVKNPRDLAKNIRRLYDDKKLRERLRRNSLERIQGCSLNNYVSGLNNIYAECLKD